MRIEQGFYGTEEETYYFNSHQELWCVQSPDLLARNGEPCRCFNLPEGAKRLSNDLCHDIDIPAEIQ